MSVEIHQFLDNSGGSNFTEHAPRPPVGPGEENELHSTGGHSNKSSGSHKSITSNRSNGSGNGGATPRRSQKPAKLPPTTANVAQAPTAVPSTEEGGENEAPLGFEPEGSVDDRPKPEFSENSTPAYSKWSESLDNLLEDADGVELFKAYLSQENHVNLFEFYFACKYLHNLQDADTKTIIRKMYRAYIKGDKKEKKLTLISAESKENIVQQVTAKQYPKTIFDDVKDQVVDILKREFYLPFFKSSIYLKYIQNASEDSPKESANSSGSASARPLSTVLPTVHEDSELDLHHVTAASNIHNVDESVLSLSAKNIVMTERLRSDYKVKPEDQAGYYLQTREDGSVPPHPYHTYNTSYLPISAIDSERQSLSSEALTDDTHSITDSSVDGFPVFTNRRSVQKHHRRIRSSAQRNPETHGSSCHNILAPKTRLAKVSNQAETDPMEFAKVLCDKLQKVLDEQNRREMVRSKLNAMSEDEGTTDDSHSILSSTTGGGAGTNNTTLNQLLSAIQAGSEDAEANQEILDMHCRRIWERSGQHTPSKSPSRAKSPDHLTSHSMPAKRMYQPLPRQAMPSTTTAHSNISLPYKSTIPPYTKPLHTTAPLAAYSSLDSGFPLSTSTTVSSYPTKSNSRQGMADFPTKAEQQSILRPPTGNQKVEEWINRNNAAMAAAVTESDVKSARKSQRSMSSSASPRAAAKNSRNHSKQGLSSSGEARRSCQEDRQSTKSKSTSSGKKEHKTMSRSAGDAAMQTLTQRKGVLLPPAAPQLKVAFFLLEEPIPYSVTIQGSEITLSKFKELLPLTKKGNYRYFFKKATDDDFGSDVRHVLEEITNDMQILPKWETKVVGYVKKIE